MAGWGQLRRAEETGSCCCHRVFWSMWDKGHLQVSTLTGDWQGNRNHTPAPSTDFCDHSCATQLSKASKAHRLCRGCSGRCRPCYPVWDTSLVSSFSRKGKTKSANIRFLSGRFKSKERTSSHHCRNSCPLQAVSSLAIHLYEV